MVTVLARDSNLQNPPRSINYAIGSCKQTLFLCRKLLNYVLMFSFHFVPVSPANGDVMFNISQTSGVLTVSGTLDRETVSRFIISVKVYIMFVCIFNFWQLRRGV